jgi:hypothetical protein
MVQYFPVITGSLTVTGSVFVSGSITATGGVTISGSIDSASYAANAERLDNLDSTSFVFTSSYNQDSSSFSTRTTNLETASGSFSTRVTTIESKYATTGSNIFTANQTICGNLTTTGTITAQTINVQQVTSSIVYSSGSNIFGCALTDRQQMTGSVTITGSLVVTTTAPELTVGATGVTLGNVVTDIHNVTGSLRITGSGNHWIVGGSVGINTTSPDIFGRGDALNVGISTTGASDNMALSLNAGASAGRGSQIYMGQGGTRHFTLSSNTTETTIGTVSNTAFRINSCDVTRLTIANSGAATFSCNVGIKISERPESLAIEHTTGNASAAYFYTTGITTGQSYGLTVFAGTNSSDRSLLVSNQGGGTPYLMVRGDGNVGIGTSNPGAKIDIDANNPTRGIIAFITNSATSGHTGAQLKFTQNSVADWVIGQPAGTDAFSIWSGRYPSVDGNERFRMVSSGIACFASSICAQGIVFCSSVNNRFGPIRICNPNSGASAFSEVAFFNNTSNQSGFFYNSSTRSDDGGVCGFTIYNDSANGNIRIRTGNNIVLATGGTATDRLTISSTGIACFANTVCAPTFIANCSLRVSSHSYTFTANKAFNENTSDVEFFKIAMPTGQAAIFVQFSSFNSGTAAYKVQTYHGVLSNNWTGWVGCGIEVTGNPSCRANFAASSINSVATYSGCLVFRVSTTNNGTSTTAVGTANITVVTNGDAPTFTQL